MFGTAKSPGTGHATARPQQRVNLCWMLLGTGAGKPQPGSGSSCSSLAVWAPCGDRHCRTEVLKEPLLTDVCLATGLWQCLSCPFLLLLGSLGGFRILALALCDAPFGKPPLPAFLPQPRLVVRAPYAPHSRSPSVTRAGIFLFPACTVSPSPISRTCRPELPG